MGQENWKKRSSEGGKRGSHAARFLGRVGTPRLPLGVPFRVVFDSNVSSYPKNRQYILLFADLISHRELSSVLCFLCFCLSVDNFECNSGIYQNSWIWSFLAVLCAIACCFRVCLQFRGQFWHLSKLVDFFLSRSFMSYCILF